jgi:hypothetical protein
MWRKYLLAIWRNSKKSCAVRKGTPASAATIDAAQGVVQALNSPAQSLDPGLASKAYVIP